MGATTARLIVLTLTLLAAGLALVAIFVLGKALALGIYETAAACARFAGEALKAVGGILARSVLSMGWFLLAVLLCIAAGVGWVSYVYWLKPGSPGLADLRPPVCAEVLDAKGQTRDYRCPFDGIRVWAPLEKLSANLRSLVVMLEDDKFYDHGGLDLDEIWNAMEKDLKARKAARGGSTITQQLAKNLFLTREKSLMRKAAEVPLALRLERDLTKERILELYLNTIEWGPGVYGAEAASRLYFDHAAAALSDPEAWLLALMIPNPTHLNPWVKPRASRALLFRARRLSRRLFVEHYLSEEQSRAAFARFESFLSEWNAAKSGRFQGEHSFPARWALSH